MTRLTAFIIATDERVYGTHYGPVNGCFGVYIGTLDESPSGSLRPRALLSSEPFYCTAEDADAAAAAIISESKDFVRDTNAAAASLMESQLDQARVRIAALEVALRKYGRHLAECDWRHSICECGLDKIISRGPSGETQAEPSTVDGKDRDGLR